MVAPRLRPETALPRRSGRSIFPRSKTAALPCFLFIAGGVSSLLAQPPQPGGGQDLDRDALPDAFEQLILARFRPALLISASDCDGAPSQFQPGRSVPTPIARNGALYGQVFPVAIPGRDGVFLEAHFYHLWAADCGPAGHPLDIEQVSALLQAPSLDLNPDAWRALYWYAAAHESTLCDSGNAALASSIGASARGPSVWISHGKHASYLSLELCKKRGCGADRCLDSVPAPGGPLINIGELSSPLNGAVWLRSRAWRFAPKLQSDFPPEALDQLTGLENEPRPFNSSRRPVKAIMLAGYETGAAISAGGDHTGKALDLADGHTASALDRASGSTGRGIAAAVRSVRRALRRTRDALTPGRHDPLAPAPR